MRFVVALGLCLFSLRVTATEGECSGSFDALVLMLRSHLPGGKQAAISSFEKTGKLLLRDAFANNGASSVKQAKALSIDKARLAAGMKEGANRESKTKLLNPHHKQLAATKDYRVREREFLATNSTRYLTWKWNGGRINNQLASLSTAARIAKATGRVLYIRRPNSQNAFLGFHNDSAISLWDMEHFSRSGYAFVLWVTVDRLYATSHPVLGNIPSKCQLREPGGDDLANVILRPRHMLDEYNTKHDCKVVDLGGKYGILAYGDSRMQRLPVKDHDFWSALIPAKYIRDQVETFASSLRWGSEHVTIHSRIFIEGPKLTANNRGKLVEDCQKSMANDLRGQMWWQGETKQAKDAEQAKYLGLLQSACWFTPENVNATLMAFNRSFSISKTDAASREHFFLASDQESHGMIEKNLSAYGAVQYPFTTAFRSRSVKWKKTYAKHLWTYPPALMNGVTEKEHAIADLLVLGGGSFFLGSARSTFSQTVCFWRGVARAKDSNFCALFLRKMGYPVEAPALSSHL